MLALFWEHQRQEIETLKMETKQGIFLSISLSQF